MKVIRVLFAFTLLSAIGYAIAKPSNEYQSGCYFIVHVMQAERDGATTRFKLVSEYQFPTRQDAGKVAAQAKLKGFQPFVAKACLPGKALGV